jgi:hypothetical protein
MRVTVSRFNSNNEAIRKDIFVAHKVRIISNLIEISFLAGDSPELYIKTKPGDPIDIIIEESLYANQSEQ